MGQRCQRLVGLARGHGAGVDDDLVGRDAHHASATAGRNHSARVPSHLELKARAHKRRVGVEKRNRLPLHIRAHKSSVRVIMLQERDQGRSHRYELVWCHIHVVDVIGLKQRKVPPLPAEDKIVDEVAVWVQRCIGLGDSRLLLFVRRKPLDLVGDPAVLDLAVGSLDKAKFVDPTVGGK